MDQVGMGVPAGAVDASGVVIIDVPCQRCSYNVRGLFYTGRCPECGAPVGPSIHGDLLRFCDPRWLERIATGASYIVWGMLVGALIRIVGLCIAGSSPLLSFTFGITAFVSGNYGTWLLTERNPCGLNEHRYVTARRAVRVTMLMRFPVSVADDLLRMLSLLPHLEVGLVRTNILVAIVELIVMLMYVELLARRIPDRKLAGRAGFIRQALGVSLGAALVGAAGLGLPKLMIGTVSRDVETVSACLYIAALLGTVVFSIMALFLVDRMSKALGEQAELARQIWGGDATP